MDRTSVLTESAEIERRQKEAEHYRAGFKNILRIVNLQAIVIIALAGGLLFYVNTFQREDRYFSESMSGLQMQMAGLPMPNMGRTAISGWVSQAAIQVMTFGFNDLEERFALSYQNFTPKGWKSFYKALTDAKLIDKVIASQQVITAIPKAEPTLVQEGIMDGVYSWVFDMPMILTFRSGGAKQTFTKTLHIVVERVPTAENPMALGIGLWVLR